MSPRLLLLLGLLACTDGADPLDTDDTGLVDTSPDTDDSDPVDTDDTEVLDSADSADPVDTGPADTDDSADTDDTANTADTDVPISDVDVNHYGVCGAFGVVATTEQTRWIAGVLTPPSAPFVVTHVEAITVTQARDGNPDCEASAAHTLRVYKVTDPVLPSSATTAGTPHEVIDFGAVSPAPTERFLSRELHSALTVNAGEHVVLALSAELVDGGAKATCVRSCVYGAPLPVDERRTFWSADDDLASQWSWTRLSLSKAHFKVVGYYP